VPVEAEVELKRLALSRGLFLMGPDCGTALVNGVPLGFANAVPRGRIGLAAASGTGLQEVSTLVARHGEGISHGIGVGGRDLSDAVGGLMMSRALAALAEDPATEVIGVIGKPPGPAVAARLTAEIRQLGKPCAVHFVGSGAGGSLEDCARAAVALARKERPVATEFTLPAAEVERLVAEAARGLGPTQRFVRGVYAGGTLAWEARAILAAVLPDVAPGVTSGAGAHRVVDLGEDVFTVGRPHPMIDGTVRRDWIVREAGDPATAVLLLDVILGYGAHPDPAGELLSALARARAEAGARGRGLTIIASVVGTDADPQGRAAQVAKLEARGVMVMPSNAQAARLAARLARTVSR
jgi:FdrA protein